MFSIDASKTIHLTRGDIAVIAVSANNDKEPYVFAVGDVVRLNVYEKKNPENIVIQKVVEVKTETEIVDISLTKSDTKIYDLINKPVDYWYEIELNPETAPQTLVGYDNKGAKIFRLYPESGDVK